MLRAPAPDGAAVLLLSGALGPAAPSPGSPHPALTRTSGSVCNPRGARAEKKSMFRISMLRAFALLRRPTGLAPVRTNRVRSPTNVRTPRVPCGPPARTPRVPFGPPARTPRVPCGPPARTPRVPFTSDLRCGRLRSTFGAERARGRKFTRWINILRVYVILYRPRRPLDGTSLMLRGEERPPNPAVVEPGDLRCSDPSSRTTGPAVARRTSGPVVASGSA